MPSKALIRAAIPAVLLFGLLGRPPAAPGETLKVGLMPAVNSIPLIVGRELGLFEREGVTVELELFKNQLYRESGLQAGAIDGSVSDLLNAVAAVSNGFALKATSYSEGSFSLLAPGSSKYGRLEDLAAAGAGGVKAGLLDNSIINFVTDKLLESAGVPRDRLESVSTPQLPVRIELLLAGRLDLACLPEPMNRLALARGARLLASSERLPSTPGVLLFTGRALKAKAAAVRAFYRAYNRAVAELARDPERWREAIAAGADFPAGLKDAMLIPGFAPARATSRAEYSEVCEWMSSRGMIKRVPAYEEVVTAEFLK